MKKLFTLLIFLLLLGTTSWAQVSSTYMFASSSGTYTPISGGTVLVQGTTSMDSWVSTAITIPSFTFAGVAYTTAYVTSNGILSLGASAPSSTSYTAISSTTGSGISICPFNADLDDATNAVASEIRWQTVGNEVIFQWSQMCRYSYAENFDFQVRLNTVNGNVVFVYELNSGPYATSSYQPQVGIRTSATDYLNRKVTTTENWNTSLAGTSNTDNCRFNGTSPATNFTTGLTYTFSIAPPCSPPSAQPTVLAVTPVAYSSTQLSGSFIAASPAPSGYVVVRYPSGAATTAPVNGTNYSAGGALGLGTVVYNGPLTTFTTTGLTANTTYDFYVYSYNNTACAPITYLAAGPLYNTGTTNPIQSISSTATGGLWSSPATWVSGLAPTNGEDYVIASGAIVTVDQTLAVRDLTISGTLQWGSSSYVLTASRNILINSGGKFLPYTTGLTGQTVNVGGDFTNNGFANLAIASTSFNFNGSTQNSSLAQTLGGTGIFAGDGTKGLIRNLGFATTGSSTISTTQPLATGGFAHTAGALNTNGKLTIDNDPQLYGQALNRQVANVAVTNMGSLYTNTPVVFGSAVSPWVAKGTATISNRYFYGNNVYLCTATGSPAVFGSTPPTGTASTTFADSTSTLLYVGTIGTIGAPFITTALTVGNQYFYGGNLYVAVATTAPGTTPPTHTSGVVGSFLYMGTPAQVSVNYDAATQTVRSLNLVNAGNGYITTAPVMVISTNGGTGGSASATAVLIQSNPGFSNSQTQKSTVATITGGLNITSNQSVGAISTTNGGVNYSAAPTVGFPLPTGFLNLMLTPGTGYTGSPTVTITGGTHQTTFTNPTITVTTAQGQIVSAICTAGGTGWLTQPTITFTVGGASVQGTAAFPANCLATATATITNGTITNFTVTNPGFGYPSAPTPTLETVGTVTTAATAPTSRIGLYNLIYNYFSPATSNPAVTAGVEIPSNNRINVLTLGSTGSSATFANVKISANLELYASSGALALPGSTSVGSLLDLNGNVLTFSHPTYSGTSGSLANGAVANGSIVLNSIGGSVTKSFPFDGTFTVATGSGSGATGCNASTLTASVTGAPSGTGNPIGKRSFRLQLNGSSVLGTSPTVTLNYNINDGLVSDAASLFVSQAPAVGGAWTTRSVTSGTGVLPATGSRTTATAAPGPINTTDQYFAWSSTYVAPPALSFNITRATGTAFNSIMSTGTIFPGWSTVSTDDGVSNAVTITGSTFTFQGQTITGFNVCTNGWMHLISASSPTTTATSYSNNMALGTIPNILAPFWDDLSTNPNDAGGVTTLNLHSRYQIIGSTPGTRQIVCEWNNYTVFGAAGPQLNFQVILDETDNSITYNYGLFQGFNGTNNHRYTYSCGIGGLVVNPFPLSGQMLAQQYENTTDFSYQYANQASMGANALSSIPQCSSAIKFTPGVYAGFTPPAQTPPSNDEAVNAITVPALLAFPANLCGNFYTSRFATKSAQKECAGNNDDDVWFKFVCTRPATTVRVYGSGGYVPRLQVMDNALGVLSTPVCVVGTAGGTAVDAIMSGLTVGNTYYIRVYHDGGGTQATATAVISGGVISYLNWTNLGSGYTSTTTGGLIGPRITITGGGGSDAAASATIVSGAVSSYSLYGGYGYTSAPTVTIESPAWAHIGEFALVVYAPSVNDECSGAITLSGLATPGCTDGANSVTDNTQSATASAEATVCGTPDDDLWYKFVAVNANTQITLSATASFDPAFQVFDGGVSGACAGKTSVSCVNANGAGVTESTLQATTVGHTYFVRVYHAGTGTFVGGTYTLCVSSAAPACVSTPTAPINYGNACVGTVLLSWPAVSGATGYDVFLDAGAGPASTSVASNQAGTTFTTAALTAGPYSWRVVPKSTNFGDAVGCADFHFTINALPTVAVTPSSASFCPGATAVALTASGAATYAWSPATGLDVTTGAVVNASPASTTTYTVVGTDSYGCTASATSAISVNPSLVVTATATPANICANGSSVLTASAGTAASGYCTPTFTTPGATSDYLNNFTFGDLTNNGSGDAPTDYTYYSALTAHVVADGVTTYAVSCEPGSATWSEYFRIWIDFNQNGIFEASESVFNSTVAAYAGTPATGTVTIPNTAINGITRMRVADRFSSQVAATESCSIASDYGEYEDYNVSINGGVPGFDPGLATYTWSPATHLSSTTGTPVTAFNVPSTITYTVTASAPGFCSGTATATITVSPLVCGALTTGGATACAGIQTVASHVSGGATPYVYAWTQDGSPYGGNTATINATVGTHSYVCLVTDNCSNTCSSTLSVTTYANPTVTVTPASATYCKPAGPAIMLTASGADTYVWTPTSGLDASTGAIVNASPSSTVTYKATGSTGQGCTGEANAVITVSQSVTMNSVTATPPEVNSGGSSVLAASASIAVIPLSYCVPASSGLDCITGVTFNTLSSTPVACVSPYYHNNPQTGTLTTTVLPGSTYALTVNTDVAGGGAIVSVWIDYNNDGVFDASEWNQVYLTGYTATINVTIPFGAVQAVTGMRIRSRSYGNPNGSGDACSIFYSGSAEDYTITIGTPSSGGTVAYTWTPGTFLSSTTGSPVNATNATATTTYTVVASAAGCSATGSVTLTVNHPPTKTIHLTNVRLEGLYAGLANPLNQAFGDAGPQYGSGVADHITVELHDASAYATIVTAVNDVELLTDATATCTVDATYSADYYITVKHRNSIETVSATAVSFIPADIYQSFGLPTDVFGGNLVSFEDGGFAIFGGDTYYDGIIDGSDMASCDNQAASFASGYLVEDCNGDGIIDGSDLAIVDNNAAAFVGVVTP